MSTLPTQPTQQINLPPKEEFLFQEIESEVVSLIIDSSSQDIIDEITTKRIKLSFWLFSLPLPLALIPAVGVLLAITIGILLYIFEGKKVGGISYQNLKITQNNQRFIEDEIVPRDGTIVDYTWQYVNKSGGPDKRFKNNRKLPVLMYSEIHCQINTGLNELIQLSKQGAGVKLIEQLGRYISYDFLSK